jgi:DNA-binding NtrC family response regulator
MMLISRDLSLAQSFQGIVDAFPDVRLLVLARAGEADVYLTRAEIKLLFVHLVDDKGTNEVIRLLRQLNSLERALALLVISERPSAEQAWSFQRLGAAEYLSRPIALCRLGSLLQSFGVGPRPTDNGAERTAGAHRTKLAQPAPRVADNSLELLLEQVRLVAAQDTTILLGGETGTGKTRLAKIIHEFSPRRAEPFVAINCGALATELIESEMFGHVKGAFTGADRTRAGKLAAAEGGTLLLDEVDALPVALQAKLLRAVEERVFEPVGSNESPGRSRCPAGRLAGQAAARRRGARLRAGRQQ